MRGVSRTSRTLRWDAVDAWCATDDRARGGRRSRVVPTPRRWRQVAWKFPRGDGGKKAGHQGERGVSRKPPRRESRIASAGPVCSCAFFRFSAHGTAGAARTRLSLRPLCFRRVAIDASLGRIAPRERGPTPHRCLTIESEIRPGPHPEERAFARCSRMRMEIVSQTLSSLRSVVSNHEAGCSQEIASSSSTGASDSRRCRRARTCRRPGDG